MELLYIEREAVYRRLRGEVPFTFSEIAVISKSLGISIDKIIGADSNNSRPLQLNILDHVNPGPGDLSRMEDFVRLYDVMKGTPDSYVGEAYNTVPHLLYLPKESLSRFFQFKWLYLTRVEGVAEPYAKIRISPRHRAVQLDIIELARHIKNYEFILDDLFMYNIVRDVKYFQKVRLIDAEETAMLKKECIEVIDNLEKLATVGRDEITGNRVRFFVSNIAIDTELSYFESQNIKVSIIKSFTLNTISSYDEIAAAKAKEWLNAVKKQSILISESNERLRIEFFKRQRRIINRL